MLLDPDRVRPRADVRTLAEALARIPVLTDRLAGVLDEPDPGALPQLPAALVRCSVADGDLLSGSARADLARLEAVCRVAELGLGGDESGPVAVGAGAEHARGRALRQAADRRQAAEAVGRADRQDTAADAHAGVTSGTHHPGGAAGSHHEGAHHTIPWTPTPDAIRRRRTGGRSWSGGSESTRTWQWRASTRAAGACSVPASGAYDGGRPTSPARHGR
ncbi:hypothetical protein HFP43_00780 [Streptomyces sp. SJ1-7]|nr:hypothetical protein [Streptomyces sp. SJ1-7]